MTIKFTLVIDAFTNDVIDHELYDTIRIFSNFLFDNISVNDNAQLYLETYGDKFYDDLVEFEQDKSKRIIAYCVYILSVTNYLSNYNIFDNNTKVKYKNLSKHIRRYLNSQDEIPINDVVDYIHKW